MDCAILATESTCHTLQDSKYCDSFETSVTFGGKLGRQDSKFPSANFMIGILRAGSTWKRPMGISRSLLLFKYLGRGTTRSLISHELEGYAYAQRDSKLG